MIIAELDPTVVEGLFAGLAAILGAYATILSRRVDQKTSSREDTQQIIDSQNDLLDRYEINNKALESRIVTLEKKVEDLIAERFTLLNKIAELTNS